MINVQVLMWTFTVMFVPKIDAGRLMMIFIIVSNMFDSTIL